MYVVFRHMFVKLYINNCLNFRKSLVTIVRHVVVNVEAGEEVAEEAVEVTTIEVERLVVLPLDCATQVLKQRPHLYVVSNNNCPHCDLVL